MNNNIKIEHLTKDFKNFKAVNDISFEVKSGEIFAFLGTNGAGKSTTIKMICSLIKPTEGDIYINGINIKQAQFSQIGIVFQNNVLDDLLSVKDNLNIRAAFNEFDNKIPKQRLLQLKDQFKLNDIWDKPFGKLSGGQKRKCEIVRALLNMPRILILDEPTTGLDPQTRKLIWD